LNSMQHIDCNLCGADETDLVVAQNGCRMVECRHCGLVYADPRPSPEMLIDLYDSYHQRNGKDETTWKRLMSLNFAEVADLLDSKLPLKGSLLDIGCGYGHFLGLMRERGWDVFGIEPSERTSAFAVSMGLNVARTVIEKASFPEGSFDAVSAFYVLEHLCDPLAVLRKIHGLLKPGGILVLRVPHTTPIVRLLKRIGVENNLYDMPFHLYDFSPVTISMLLGKAGFCAIRVMPGSPTLPPRRSERLVSLMSGNAARLLYALSGGTIHLPGTSKTVFAVKAAMRQVANDA